MHKRKIDYLTKVGMLGAVAVLLMFLEVPLPLLPVFLKLDISDLPAVIGAFALGPGAAVWIEFIKNGIHAINTQTVGIGELANFLVGAAFTVPMGYLYKVRPDFSGVSLALITGTLSMVFAASILNYFVLLPLYQAVLHFPLDKLVAMGTAANPQIVDLKTFITFAIAPFNLIKGIVIAAFTLLIYKKVLPLLRLAK